MPVCIYNRVRERDIDVLFMNSFITDKDFAKLLIDKTKYAGMEPEVLSGELSHTELNLGESDITFIIKTGL